MSFEDLASAFVSGVRVFIITHLQYITSIYNAKMRVLQGVTVKYVASVAQLVEQLTLNQLVWGSSPHRGTTSPSTCEDSKPAQSPQERVMGSGKKRDE